MTNNVTYSYRVDDAKPSTYLTDGVLNVINGIGTRRDAHASASTWGNEFITQQEIENSYKTSWTSRKVHDVVANDIVRPWRAWLAEPEQITAIEAEERRLGLRQKVRKAFLLSRLFGGSIIMMGVEGDDPSTPLDVSKVKRAGLSYIHVLSRHEVTIEALNLDPGSPQYGEPTGYIVNGGTLTIHPTRCVRFTQGDLPDSMAFANQGWGQPLLLTLRSALLNADIAQAAFAALPVKARTSILAIPGMTEKASTKDGEQQLIGRMTVASMAESMFNTTLLSAPKNSNEAGETLTHNQITWSGIPEVGTWFIQMVAAAADIPLTRFGSISPGGLNSTGDADLANHYANLDAGRELDLRPRMEMIDEVMLRSALGNRPPQITFQWLPFEVDSETVRAANSKVRADAIKTLADSGTVPSEVMERIAKGVIIDSEEYPGAEDAYKDYEKAGEVDPLPESEADNDNTVLAATTEGLVAQGRSASVAARDARIMLADAVPMPLYVSRPLLNGDDLVAWARDNGLNPIHPSKMHVTVAYSRSPLDWMQLGTDDWSDEGGVKVLGGPRMLERFGPESKVIVLAFSSSRLGYRHEEILRAGASWDWPEYQPHVTIDYDAPDDIDIDAIKPFTGELRFGVERFEKLDTDWSSND